MPTDCDSNTSLLDDHVKHFGELPKGEWLSERAKGPETVVNVEHYDSHMKRADNSLATQCNVC